MDNLMIQPIGSMCLSKAGTSAGTTSTVTTANTVQYTLDGRAYSAAAAANQVTPTTDFLTQKAFKSISANQGTVVVLGYDKAGTAVIAAQGDIEDLDVQGNFFIAPQIPQVASGGAKGYDFAAFCVLILKGGATLSGTFTFGTDNLSGVTGMTYTFVDVNAIPSRPIVG